MEFFVNREEIPKIGLHVWSWKKEYVSNLVYLSFNEKIVYDYHVHVFEIIFPLNREPVKTR